MCNSLSICNINRIIFVLQTLRLTSYPDPGFDTCTPRSRPKQTASRMLHCWLASGSSGQWKEVAGGQAVGGVRIMEFVLPAPMPACCLAKAESLPEHNSYPGSSFWVLARAIVSVPVSPPSFPIPAALVMPL